MVRGIGTDIIEIRNFRGLSGARKRLLFPRMFTKRELAYCLSKRDPAPHLAARFAAKEAAWKAFESAGATRTHLYSFLLSLEVENDARGVPRLKFLERRLRSSRMLLSLSHSREHALATVLLV